MEADSSAESRWGRGRDWRRPLAVAALAVVVLAAEGAVGPASRSASGGVTVVRCETPAEFLRTWRERGVRGRTLVYAARRIAVSPDAADPEGGYLLVAMREGLVRRVFHAVSESAWPEVRTNLGRIPGARFDGRAFHLRIEGVAVVVLPLPELPALREPVLVTVDLDAHPEPEIATLAHRLATGALRADLVAWIGPRPSPALEALRESAR